ncbi:MAG: MBL fold metallo-hydrolase, partial [Planctomycetota bacterium JB042]
AASLLLGLAACAAPGDEAPPPSDAPYAVVLGTAQDAGIPQIACPCDRCAAAREDPSARRLVTSVLLADPRSGRRFLLDASPDLAEQVERARPHPPGRRTPPGRPPLFDAIFLTHAHAGHYTGLLELGNEAYGADGQRVVATPRMAAFLRANDPWRFLVDRGFVVLEELPLETEIALADDLTLEALPVPHRDEHSDTVAFVVRGPARALLYLPDIDKWDRWDRRLEDVLAEVDVALVDGTFFADGEIPGRAMAEIPHPFIEETIARLKELPEDVRAKVVFTHLNHTNPAADPESDAARTVREAGMAVAEEGATLGMGLGAGGR